MERQESHKETQWDGAFPVSSIGAQSGPIGPRIPSGIGLLLGSVAVQQLADFPRTHPLTCPWLRAFDTSVGALHTGSCGAGDGVMRVPNTTADVERAPFTSAAA